MNSSGMTLETSCGRTWAFVIASRNMLASLDWRAPSRLMSDLSNRAWQSAAIAASAAAEEPMIRKLAAPAMMNLLIGQLLYEVGAKLHNLQQGRSHLEIFRLTATRQAAA